MTVILPKGKTDKSYPAAWFSLNGDGEMTGLAYIEDYGRGSGPIAITNTNSVGVVRDAVGEWCVKKISGNSQQVFHLACLLLQKPGMECLMISMVFTLKKNTYARPWMVHQLNYQTSALLRLQL